MGFTAVLFDYSGVLTTPLGLPEGPMPYDPEVVFVEMAAALGSTEPHLWHDLERGECTLEEFVAFVEGKAPGAGVLFDAGSEHNTMGGLELRDDRLAVVRHVKSQGYKVALVTNSVAEWKPLWRPALPDDLFDVVVDSAEVGCRKPEPAIYEHTLAALGVDSADQAVFVDDFEWNVNGAIAVGMTGLHCRPDDDLAATLSQILHPKT